MENRSKFYGKGKWANHTIEERYEKICWALDAYRDGFLDDVELDFIIKNAFVSRIYVSKQVVDNYCGFCKSKSQIRNLYNELVHDYVLDLQQSKDNRLNNKYFHICQLGININKTVKDKANNQNKVIVFEHVIPGNLYLDKAKELQLDKPNRWFDEFKQMFNCVSVCLVTGEQNNKLNKFQSRMPDEKYDNEFINYPFARYDKALGGVGIEIHGWRILNGIPFKEVNNTIFFESDEEFEDFCVAPYATIKQSENGTNYCAGDYSDIYKECVKEGKLFVIKDRNSKVYKRKAVTKRVPLNDPNSPARRRETVPVQLKVQNMKQWYPLMEKMLKKKEKRANDELSDTNS